MVFLSFLCRLISEFSLTVNQKINKSILMRVAHALAKSTEEGSYRERLGAGLQLSWHVLKEPLPDVLPVSSDFVKKVISDNPGASKFYGSIVDLGSYKYPLNSADRAFLKAHVKQPELAVHVKEDEYEAFANGTRKMFQGYGNQGRKPILEIKYNDRALHFLQTGPKAWHRLAKY